MEILNGIQNGMVMQRNENDFCECYLEINAIGKVKTDKGNIEQTGNEYRLTGIKTGGPYTVTISDNEESITYTDIYVGDVWVLAGQSNMEGEGLRTEEDKAYDLNPNKTVRAFYLNDEWKPAESQLHQLWDSHDKAHVDYYFDCLNSIGIAERKAPAEQNSGVGPGLFIGREMLKRTGVPQGLIPCAVNGSCLSYWEEDGDFYKAAIRRFKKNGSHVRGMFWDQGAAEANEEGIKVFLSRMNKIVDNFRRDFRDENLPIVQGQMSKNCCYPGCNDIKNHIYWSQIREIQRTMTYSNFDTVFAMDLGYDDCIHYSSDSQKKIALREAESMYVLCGEKGKLSPIFKTLEITVDPKRYNWCSLFVHYDNLEGGLKSDGVPSGFSVIGDNEEVLCANGAIASTILHGDYIEVKTELTYEQLLEKSLYYGYGLMYWCDITDGAGRSIPGMGPIKIKDFIMK